MNGIIINDKVYTAEMGHPDCFALCSICDLSDYCKQTDKDVCAAIASPTDHFKLNLDLTYKLNRPYGINK